MKNHLINKLQPIESFVDAREAAYTMNLPMYYLTNATQRAKMEIPYYRIGRMIRFKLSELAEWMAARCDQEGDHA
jgi:excisionase family DNA binding protein